MSMETAAPAAVAQGERRNGGLPAIAALAEPAQKLGGRVPVFYINRQCDAERRAAIELELKQANVVGERIDAVEGLAVPEALKPYFFDGEELSSQLKPGEIGCYASHLKAFNLVRARGLRYALIVEDDALLFPGFAWTIEDILAKLPDGWDLVHLSGNPRRAVKPVARLEQGRALVRYSRVPGGTVGYLVSERGAKKFLAPTKRYWPVDTDLRRPWVFGLEIYGVVPRIIEHDEALQSPIQALGGRARGRRGIVLPSRASWTGNPLHCPEGTYFNFKTLGPLWWLKCWSKNVRALVGSYLHAKTAPERLLKPMGDDARAVADGANS